MCRCCKGVTNIHQRVANHDFLEQLAEFYQIAPKHFKNRKYKNIKKSVFAKIKYQISQLQELSKVHQEYEILEQKLSELLIMPFDETSTQLKFESILNSICGIKQDEILEYYRSINNG